MHFVSNDSSKKRIARRLTMGPEAIFNEIKEKDARGISLLAKPEPPEWKSPGNGASKHAGSAYYVPFLPVYRLGEDHLRNTKSILGKHLIWKDFLEGISQDLPFNTSPSIEDIIREIAKEVPDEEWKKLPHDIVGRLDYHLHGAEEE